MRCASFTAITVAGFGGSIAQVLILRELLVLFHGNELSTGLVFTGWLLWTALGSGLAGLWGNRTAASPALLPVALGLQAILLPLTVLWIRGARITWSIPTGELIGPGRMLEICLSSTSLFCITSGFLFAFAWSVHAASSRDDEARPVLIYLGEAAGAAAGGLCFYFLLLPAVPALTAAWLVSAVLASTALVLAIAQRRALRVVPVLSGLFLLCAGVSLFFLSPGQERMSRQWQWGTEPLAVLDTPYHNLALLKHSEQYTLFANGLWLFTVPDPQTAEYAVHLALLQHPQPRTVLLLGGGAAGLIDEILKHPHIEAVDYVEADPEILRMAEAFLPDSLRSPIHDARVHLFHADGSSFIRMTSRTYDVVLLNGGDPLNAEVNRFYTLEFYERVRRLLNPGGIFSFGVSSAPDIIGPAQARLLRSIHATLRSAFPFVMVYPGESARFFATDAAQILISDPQELVDRFGARNLQLRYVREYYLFDYLNPLRMDYMASVLAEGRVVPVNRDFAPTCYFNSLVVWSAQLHPILERTLIALSELEREWFWGGFAGFVLLMVVAFRVRLRASAAAVAVSVLVMGAALMVLEIVLLLGFQILEGFVYRQLALIITCFMSGIALGAAVVARFSSLIARPRLQLMITQALFGLYLMGVLKLLYMLQHQLQAKPHHMPSLPVIFSALALAGGILGGMHFALAVKTLSTSGMSKDESRMRADSIRVAQSGPQLYALDLAGAALGALTASLFLLPIYGLVTTMVAMTLLVLASLVILQG